MLARLRNYIAKADAAPGPDSPLAGRVALPERGYWHVFTGDQWAPISSPPLPAARPTSTSAPPKPLRVVTWNVDGFIAPAAEARLTAILDHILTNNDLVLLQELSPDSTAHLLSLKAVREGWYSTASKPSDRPIIQATLASRWRFGPNDLGEVQHIPLPSRFARDLVVADVHMDGEVVRSVNAHLDSLAHEPSYRPQQVQIAAQSVRDGGGCGFIAGDWNSVLPVDDGLCRENGLVDAWEELHPDKDGFTWNWDGRSREPFPPNRLDKVALLGLKCSSITVLEPGSLQEIDRHGRPIDWSDHCGLRAELSALQESRL